MAEDNDSSVMTLTENTKHCGLLKIVLDECKDIQNTDKLPNKGNKPADCNNNKIIFEEDSHQVNAGNTKEYLPKYVFFLFE